jgi:hypothetical protein
VVQILSGAGGFGGAKPDVMNDSFMTSGDRKESFMTFAPAGTAPDGLRQISSQATVS